MTEVNIQKSHIDLDKILKEKGVEINASQYLYDCDILVIPEEYGGELCYNMDVLDLSDKLKEGGLKVKTINPDLRVIEKKGAEIELFIGIVKDIILPVVLPIVSRFIVDRIAGSYIYKKAMPKAKVTFYQEKKRVSYEYDDDADRVANALRNFRFDDNG